MRFNESLPEVLCLCTMFGMHPLIAEFKEKAVHLQEVDRGDFRRRLTLYINRLSEELPHNSQKTVKEMKNLVLYNGPNDSEELREALLKKLLDFN